MGWCGGGVLGCSGRRQVSCRPRSIVAAGRGSEPALVLLADGAERRERREARVDAARLRLGYRRWRQGMALLRGPVAVALRVVALRLRGRGERGAVDEVRLVLRMGRGARGRGRGQRGGGRVERVRGIVGGGICVVRRRGAARGEVRRGAGMVQARVRQGVRRKRVCARDAGARIGRCRVGRGEGGGGALDGAGGVGGEGGRGRARRCGHARGEPRGAVSLRLLLCLGLRLEEWMRQWCSGDQGKVM
ncbi:hypothetical protein FA95DRAFT_1319278 [Auriscalpium vulgare]|uniref:Uncharacterized protein n=1 Tax=Auriscalpium vulgare TaxID=40419 RepID=A0ACB8S907_9AGAM|nr:hypothetical protein FA95DRAFT_1319278 [Auriscalpium vulgare]